MTWRVQVDFDDDGDFWKAGNQITGDVRDSFRFFNGCRPFEMLGDEAGLDLVVSNTDRTYSPEYSGSRLYGKLRPGRAIRVVFDRPGAGLEGQYFNHASDLPSLTEPVRLERVDGQIDFEWGYGSPDPDINTDYFSVRWRGLLTVPTTGSYTFYAEVTHTVRLWVGGTQVINKVTNPSANPITPTEYSGSITLEAGRVYDLTMEFVHSSHNAVCRLKWEGPGVSKAVVPAAAFSLPPWTLWQGYIEEIRPEPLRFGGRTARIICAGQKRVLERIWLPYFGYREGALTVTGLVKDVLRQALTPGDPYGTAGLLDVSGIRLGGRALRRFGDTLRSEANKPPLAWDALYSLVEYEGGKLFYNRNRWEFWPRGHGPDQDDPADVTLDNTALELDYSLGLDAVINQADYTATPRKVADEPVTVFAFTPEQVIEIPYEGEWRGRFFFAQDGAPVTLSPSPSPERNFSLVGSVGAHYLGDVYYSTGWLYYGVNEYIRNELYDVMRITDLTYSGYPIETGDVLGGTAEDAASIQAYGPRGASFSSPLAEEVWQVKGMAEWYVARYKEPVPAARSVRVAGQADGTENLDQLRFGVGNSVRVIDDQTAHDLKYLIVGEEHLVDVAAGMHETIWHLEPLDVDRAFVLDESNLDEDRLIY